MSIKERMYGSCFAQSSYTSIFSKATPETVALINKHKICNFYKKGQVLFTEGAFPFGLYYLKTGKAKLSHLGQDGKEQIIRLINAGDVMGYRALISNDRYNGSAVTLDDSNVSFIPKEVFLHVLQTDASVGFELMKLLSSELKTAELRLTYLAQKPVRERLAETLLFIKDTYGCEQDSITLDVRLSREEIANLVGTATESIIRLLSEFNRDGIVALDGKKIKIVKEDELTRIANIENI